MLFLAQYQIGDDLRSIPALTLSLPQHS